jgi:hypothetical protein
MRYPVEGATRRELEAAALILYDRGFDRVEVAAVLRTPAKLVSNAIDVRNKRARRARRTA